MTFAEIAAELGVDERSARRIVEALLAKLRAGLGDVGEREPELVVRTLVLVLGEREGNYSSTGNATISGAPRRFLPNVGSSFDHAERAAGLSNPSSSTSPLSRVDERRARLPVPRRFGAKK